MFIMARFKDSAAIKSKYGIRGFLTLKISLTILVIPIGPATFWETGVISF